MEKDLDYLRQLKEIEEKDEIKDETLYSNDNHVSFEKEKEKTLIESIIDILSTKEAKESYLNSSDKTKEKFTKVIGDMMMYFN